MRADEIITALLERSGMTAWSAATAAGMRGQQIYGILRRGGIPRADVLARVAAACGYEIVARPRGGGEEIAIDPAPRERAE